MTTKELWALDYKSLPWHSAEGFSYTKEEECDHVFLVDKVDFRDAVAYRLRSRSGSDWYDFGRFVTAGEAKRHAFILAGKVE